MEVNKQGQKRGHNQGAHGWYVYGGVENGGDRVGRRDGEQPHEGEEPEKYPVSCRICGETGAKIPPFGACSSYEGMEMGSIMMNNDYSLARR